MGSGGGGWRLLLGVGRGSRGELISVIIAGRVRKCHIRL